MTDNKYQVMPDLTDEEFEALKADIAERGVMVAVELDEDGSILDGHHRVRACEELGITDYPTIVRKDLTEEQKVSHALKLNTERRQITPDQMFMIVSELIKRFPEKSNRALAKMSGISRTTVGKYRERLEQMGQVATLDTREGEDGKTYPSKRKPTEQPRTLEDDPFLKWQCCICRQYFPVKKYSDGKISRYGMNNAWPLSYDGHCCDHCDNALVMPSRVILEMTRGEEGAEAAKKMELKLLATDAITSFTIDADGQPDYELPRALAVMDVLDGKAFDKMADENVNPILLAYKIASIAEKANTLEVWEAARDACREMQQDYAEIVDLLDAKEAELKELAG